MDRFEEILDNIGRGSCLTSLGCLWGCGFLLLLLFIVFLLATLYGVMADAYDSAAVGVAAVVFGLVLIAATLYVIYLIGKWFSRP
jgi:hypothetical protein